MADKEKDTKVVIDQKEEKKENSPEIKIEEKTLEEIVKDGQEGVEGIEAEAKNEISKREEIAIIHGADKKQVEKLNMVGKKVEDGVGKAEKAYGKEIELLQDKNINKEKPLIDSEIGENGNKTEKENNFVNSLEAQGLVGEEIKDEYLKIKNDYKQKLINENKKPKEGDTWDELIMEEMDKKYSEFIKTKVGDRDQKTIDAFEETSDEKMMPLKYRQEFLNILFKNPNRLYADKNGEMVSMQDYLKDYYKGIGVNIEIKFKTIDPDVKKSLAGNLLRDEFLFMGLDNNASQEKSHQEVEEGNEKISYILNDEVAIPHLIIERENLKKEIPLIAGSRDLHMPLRNEKRNEAGERERKGHFVQSQVIHAPKFGNTMHKVIAFNIHEIDHAIKEIMPTKNQNDLDQRVITEGTAEKASIGFMETQHKHLKNNSAVKNFDGYDYQANLQQVLGRSAVSEKSSNNMDHRYAQGYTLTKGYEGKEGEEKYKKLFYTGELNINEELGDVVKIREKIDEQFIKQKEMCKKIMLGKMDEEK